MSSTLDIHRLLDGAFAGIDMTPEAQDLKEEMRANLVARVAELTAAGATPVDAAHRAIAELGDVRSLVADVGREAGPTRPWESQRVRPRPAFVLRTVIVALVGLGALAVATLLAFGVLEAGSRPVLDYVAPLVVVALAGAVIVGDALRQETTANYPVGRARAAGYGTATALGLAGLGTGAGYAPWRQTPWLVVGGVLAVLSIVFFTYLGTTQTNRHKPWVVREMRRHQEVGDRFTQDPAAAARFGIYTVVIWLVAITAFGVLGFTVGWAWSWLALLGGLVVMMLTLAQMLFGGSRTD